jgi:hypothetical protein
MSRARPLPIPVRVAAVSVTLAALAAVPSTALGVVDVTRAELKSGELRVEGRGAVPNAMITVNADSVVTGRADGSGAFRVEASGYRSSTCRVTVSDGAGSSEAALEECTTVAPDPDPAPA